MFFEQHVEQVSYQGIRFCPTCHNILIPYKANENILQFNCKNCGKLDVDFTEKTDDDCLLYSRQMNNLLAEEDGVVDKEYALDPTMPRIKAVCDNCDFEEAVYCLQPEQGQRKVKVLLVCARVEKNKVICGNSWELDSDVKLG